MFARDSGDPGNHDNPRSAAWFLQQMRAAGADYSARTLTGQFAAHAGVDDPKGVVKLAGTLNVPLPDLGDISLFAYGLLHSATT